MVRTRQLPTIAVLMACLLGSSGREPLFASEPGAEPASGVSDSARASTVEQTAAPDRFTGVKPSHFTFGDDWLTTQWSLGASGAAGRPGAVSTPGDSTLSFSAQRGRGRARNGGRRNAAVGAVILGAAATITGAALLVYANRPDCSANRTLNGCGYGTKVVGGAVLSAGVVGMVAGAIAW